MRQIRIFLRNVYTSAVYIDNFLFKMNIILFWIKYYFEPRQVKGIEQTLLIVSIDTREAEIISFLESVSFAPLLIIYHPYSMAFFKGQYPETGMDIEI